MEMRKKIVYVLTALASASAITYLLSRRKLRARLAGQSQVIQTSVGPVEYVDVGNGPVAVHVHGMLGGYDHWKWCEFLVNAGYRVIVPSRPGYLRTPLSSGRTPAEQAELLAGLLDLLGIEQVVLYAYSQGGTSSLEFACAYPQRCSGLILFSALTQPQPELSKVLPYMRFFMSQDFLLWLLKPVMLSLLMAQAKKALSKEVQQDKDQMAGLREIFEAFFQASLRGPGLINDISNTVSWPGLPLERLVTPALIIQGGKDIFVKTEESCLAAQKIPGARFLLLEDAGHEALVTCVDRIRPEILDFLKANTPAL